MPSWLGLEILIIADIVLTIAVDSTVESALTLGIVVLVRTVLSSSLEIELEGCRALATQHYPRERIVSISHSAAMLLRAR